MHASYKVTLDIHKGVEDSKQLTDEILQLFQARRAYNWCGDPWFGDLPRQGDLGHANATLLGDRCDTVSVNLFIIHEFLRK